VFLSYSKVQESSVNNTISCGVCCSDGGPQTPAHHCSDFSFKTYAPVAFQYFRQLFDIRSDDYMVYCLIVWLMVPLSIKKLENM